MNQPVSLVVDDPKAERELKKGGSKPRLLGLYGPYLGVLNWSPVLGEDESTLKQ